MKKIEERSFDSLRSLRMTGWWVGANALPQDDNGGAKGATQVTHAALTMRRLWVPANESAALYILGNVANHTADHSIRNRKPPLGAEAEAAKKNGSSIKGGCNGKTWGTQDNGKSCCAEARLYV